MGKASDAVPASSASDADVIAYNGAILAEYRANGGRVGGVMAGLPLALLTTVGARSGLERETLVLQYARGGRHLVVASNFGRDRHPDWYHNLRRHPRAVLEVDGERFPVDAVILAGTERDRAFDFVVGRFPVYADY